MPKFVVPKRRTGMSGCCSRLTNAKGNQHGQATRAVTCHCSTAPVTTRTQAAPAPPATPSNTAELERSPVTGVSGLKFCNYSQGKYTDLYLGETSDPHVFARKLHRCCHFQLSASLREWSSALGSLQLTQGIFQNLVQLQAGADGPRIEPFPEVLIGAPSWDSGVQTTPKQKDWYYHHVTNTFTGSCREGATSNIYCNGVISNRGRADGKQVGAASAAFSATKRKNGAMLKASSANR
ncbi:hypothetical protein BJV78DRAFT_1261122 [Lactifluus subvellereus]|nr:hypothetical protein BJV78DRAFT_1261122 [Lactifluus subvellereus]